MVVKLLTPVMYEGAIDILNRARPVSIADVSKQVIDYPILAEQSSKAVDVPKGRLLRCDRNGAVLVSRNSVHQESFVLITKTFLIPGMNWFIDFGRVVEWVSLQITGWQSGYGLSWSNSSYTQILETYITNGVFFIPFRGQIMYFISFVSQMPLTARFYGFYK